jgi:hemoglobin-like flavoprotein
MSQVSELDCELFNDSYRRCLRKPGFLDRFYEIFIASSPEIAEKFQHTDFRKQTAALKASLFILMLSSTRTPEVTQHLERLAEMHSRRQLDIRPELYDLWLESLLKAVREFDANFDEQTESAWRHVVDPDSRQPEFKLCAVRVERGDGARRPDGRGRT